MIYSVTSVILREEIKDTWSKEWAQGPDKAGWSSAFFLLVV
jgi:hypothetical protein